MRSFSNHLVFVLILSTGCAHSLSAEEAVKRFFEYFKVDNPVGIPVANFPEPAELPSPLELVPVTVIDGKLLGHSKVEIVQVMANLVELKGMAKVKAPRVEFTGQYSWPGLFSTSEGSMNATLMHVEAIINIFIAIDEGNAPLLSDVELDLEYDDVLLNMTNLQWEQELLFSTGSLKIFFYDIVMELFRQMKPLVLELCNGEIKKFVSTLPLAEMTAGSNAPSLKIFLQRLFKYVGLEPLRLPGRKSRMLGMNFEVTHIVLSGLTVVNDVNSLLVLYHERQIYVEFKMTYPTLLLSYTLELNSGIFLNLDTDERNQLNNVEISAKLTIDPKLAVPPQIKDFNIKVGSFGKVKSGKKSSIINFMRVMFANLANEVRSEIVSALSSALKRILQDELNKVNIEKELSNFVKSKGTN